MHLVLSVLDAYGVIIMSVSLGISFALYIGLGIYTDKYLTVKRRKIAF